MARQTDKEADHVAIQYSVCQPRFTATASAAAWQNPTLTLTGLLADEPAVYSAFPSAAQISWAIRRASCSNVPTVNSSVSHRSNKYWRTNGTSPPACSHCTTCTN